MHPATSATPFVHLQSGDVQDRRAQRRPRTICYICCSRLRPCQAMKASRASGTVYKPSQLPISGQGSDDPFHAHGDQELFQFCCHCIAGFSAAERLKVRRWIHQAGLSPIIGSICSGTESTYLVAQAVFAALAKVLEIPTRCRHGFSNDINSDVQRFLLDVFGTHAAHLFTDALQLGSRTAACCSCTCSSASSVGGPSTTRCTVPACNFLFAGFPCQDVTALQGKAAPEKRRAVTQGLLRTGTVFSQGVCGYVQNHGSALQSVFLENVLGLVSHPAASDKI